MTSTLCLTFFWHLKITFTQKRLIVECHFLAYINTQNLRKVKK